MKILKKGFDGSDAKTDFDSLKQCEAVLHHHVTRVFQVAKSLVYFTNNLSKSS